MKYRVFDDIAYEASVPGKDKPEIRSAREGDVVELTAKDAAALLKRGAVKPEKE